MMTSLFSLTLLLLQLSFSRVEGHARLYEPPSRSSMWRFGFSNPPNYNDNELNCGGFAKQWDIHGGNCGVCGDPYEQASPRDNERGGNYGQFASTVRSYTEGSTITVTVDVTSNHKGWFEVRVCPTNDKNQIATHTCLDQYLLPLADNSGTRYPLPTGSHEFSYDVKLPTGLTCDWCVLQWKYHAGNSWGTFANGTACVGCGDKQEEFYGCADVSITSNGAPPTTTVSPATTTVSSRFSTGTTTTTAGTPTTTTSTTTTGTPATTTTPGATTTTTTTTGTPATTTTAGTPATTTTPGATTTTTTTTGTPAKTTTATTTTTTSGTGSANCPRPAGVWATVAGMDDWCRWNCAAGYCPASHCISC